MFRESEVHDSNNHCYRVYTHYGSDWLQKVSEEYKRLRSYCVSPLKNLRVEGIAFDITLLQARLQQAAMPDYPSGVRPSLEVVRSDFGELIGYILLETLWGTSIPYKSIRDRDTINQPARGLDIVGIEEGVNGSPLTLILGEVKVSEESKTPPQVVDTANDSLRNQHLNHVSNPTQTRRKLWDMVRRIRDESAATLLQEALLLWEMNRLDKLKIVNCCVLLRPSSQYKSTDYGSFYNSPDDYKPGSIRFLIASVDDIAGRIDTVVGSFHDLATENIHAN